MRRNGAQLDHEQLMSDGVARMSKVRLVGYNLQICKVHRLRVIQWVGLTFSQCGNRAGLAGDKFAGTVDGRGSAVE